MFHVRLEMDMPCIGGSVERVKLVGEPAASAMEALQNMSQIVIDYLQHTVGVVIVDMHYGRMKELEKRLSEANAFASASQRLSRLTDPFHATMSFSRRRYNGNPSGS
jgi:hypothetical protein